MPDKRQESKQRRAARNRASRQALAARRDNAVVNTSPGSSTSSSTSSTTSGGPTRGAATNGGTAAASAPPPKGIMGMLQSKRAGDKAVLAAFGLAVAAAIYLLFYQVPADDRGEPLPATFRGLAILARERLTGREIGDNKVSLLDASGPQIFLVLALPIAVTIFALWANRRPDRSRMLTFAMLAMAGSVIFTGGIGIFFFPAMIALAVGGFRVRKADLPARTAERAAAASRRGRGRGQVIDAESEEVTDDADAAADAADEPPARSRRKRRGATVADSGDAAGAGEPADGEPGDAGPASLDDPVDSGAPADEVDPLAELEAELEAERAAEGKDEPGDEGWSRSGS